MLNIMSSEDDIQQDDQDDLQQDDEDDEDDDDQPITKRRKTDPTKWSDSDHKIWLARFKHQKGPPTLSGVKQMLEMFPGMVKKMNYKYTKYDARQRINMLANTVRQFVGRHKDR